MTIEFRAQNAYQAQIQVLAPSPVTVNVQGRWAITPTSGNQASLQLTHTQWTPPEAPMKPTTALIELVDRNTFRGPNGLATRVQ